MLNGLIINGTDSDGIQKIYNGISLIQRLANAASASYFTNRIAILMPQSSRWSVNMGGLKTSIVNLSGPSRIPGEVVWTTQIGWEEVHHQMKIGGWDNVVILDHNCILVQGFMLDEVWEAPNSINTYINNFYMCTYSYKDVVSFIRNNLVFRSNSLSAGAHSMETFVAPDIDWEYFIKELDSGASWSDISMEIENG